MNITVQRGEIQKKADEAIVVNLFEEARPSGASKAVDQALDGLIGEALDCGDFKGAKNDTLLLYTQSKIPARRVLIVGLGKQEDFDLEAARQAAGTAAHTLQGLGVKQASSILHGSGAGNLPVEAVAQAMAEASLLACYRFDHYRSGKKKSKELKKLTLLESDKSKIAAARRGARVGQTIAEATCLARDLANHPGNIATPSYLASSARQIARDHGLKCQVIDEAGMKRLGMGALLGVSQGSAEPARFIILEHNKKAGGQPLVFVGKGVTFDSGGISIKPGASMEDMKFDMCGGAAVLGAMQAVAALDLPHYIVGLVAATENLLDGKAFKPGDILKTLSGKTIEILNTDAEGRLILADTLAYAARYKPAAAIDLATLTGACVVALGHHASGMLGNDEELAEKVRQAGEQSGERVWPLPLWDEYRQQIKSDVADMKNTGGGRDAGISTAAALLAEFAEGYPWVHLDIAGTAWSKKSRPYIPKGGVGVGVRLLTQLARNWKGT
jgi:leucyl aminopeptidase